MSGFEIVGMIVTALVVIGLAWLLLAIAANIFWGIVGAYRLKAILFPNRKIKISDHPGIIGFGFKNWLGDKRLRADGCGTYISHGMMKLPYDGRDKIQRDRIPG